VKKGDKKKQQKALKRRTERKQVRKQENVLQVLSPLRYIRQARSYPIEGCWVQQGWDEGGLAVVVIARRQPNGNIVFGNYLVDLYCLGLKDTYFNADIPSSQFQHEFLPKMFRTAGKPIKISPDLAHEIIYGSIEYARQFGFRPHRDFAQSQFILDPPDAHPRTGKVKFGKDGKPFFISGPHDNVDAILRQLARTAGEGNYHFLTQIGGPPPDEWEDDEWEGNEEDTLDEKISQQHLTGEAEQDKRIAQVLVGVSPDDEMVALDVWDKYLTQHLAFPFEAEVAEFQERGPLHAGDRIQVIDISELDDLHGILVHVRAKREDYDFPLCDLEVVDKRSSNYQVVDDYAVWFANR
jgi:hypothetical protein